MSVNPASSAVRRARTRGLLSTRPNSTPSRRSASFRATSSPSAVSSSSVCEVCSPSRLHSVSPWRMTHSSAAPSCVLMSSRSLGLGPGPVLVRLRHWAAGLFAAALGEVAVLGHHHLAAEQADDLAVLVVADGLDVHDATVVLALALPLVEHGRLAVQGVAVEGRRDVAQ